VRRHRRTSTDRLGQVRPSRRNADSADQECSGAASRHRAGTGRGDACSVEAGFERTAAQERRPALTHCSHQNGGGSWASCSRVMGPRAGATVV
jgi:hypothetical protein